MHAEIAYLFRHALMRDAAYSLQLPAARAGLHGLALEIIEQVTPESDRDVGAVELADHARHALEDPKLSPEQRDHLKIVRLHYLKRGAEYCTACHRVPESAALYRELADHSEDPLQRATAQFWAAVSLHMMGRVTDAEQLVQTALHVARAANATDLEARCLRSMILLYRDTGRYSDVARLLARVDKLLPRIQDLGVRGDILAMRCSVHVDFNRLDEAVRDGRECVQLRRERGAKRPLAWSLINLGHALSVAAEFAETRSVYEEALELARKDGDDWDLGAVLTQFAGFERLCGNLERAVKLMAEAQPLLRRCGNLFALSQAYCDAGGIRHQQGLLNEARGQYLLGLEVAREASTLANWAVTTCNFALCCVEQGRFDEAAPLFDAVIDYTVRNGVLNQRAVALTNRAVLEADTGRLEDAIATTNQALRLCSGGSDRMFEAINLGNHARLCWLSGKLDDAREGFAKCLSMCQRYEFVYFQGVYLAEHAHFLICIGEPAGEELKRAEAAIERVGNMREWAGRLAPALVRQAVLEGRLDDAEELVNRARAILDRAGILPTAYTARSVAEAAECIASTRRGEPLFRAFRASWLGRDLMEALQAEQ